MREVARMIAIAGARAVLHGAIALALMLLMEFSISGNLAAYPLYLCASGLIVIVLFIYHFLLSRRRARRNPETGHTHQP